MRRTENREGSAKGMRAEITTMKAFEELNARFVSHVTMAQLNYAVHVSLKHKYVYVETPKVGCSTIKNTLQRMELDRPEMAWDDLDLLHSRHCSPLLRPDQIWGLDNLLNDNRYFTFCFVRNPYSRLLSCYLDKIVNNKPAKRRILKTMGEDPERLDRSVSFPEFVEAVCAQSFAEMDPHYRSQFFHTMQDEISYDFIGRFEKFEAECMVAFARIRSDYAKYYRPELDHSTNASDRLLHFYDEGTGNKVYDKFRIDFDHFRYAKDLIL